MRRSPLNQQGKKAREWLRVRRAWVKAHPPDHQGGYLCVLCGRWVHATGMELDHIVSRSRAPQSFGDMSNLQPTCHSCNQGKGSRTVSAKVTHAELELRRLLNL